ncbi:unnamed protein product [Darwinula stevensoni]|uniref:TGF-beta propeptide domain-containing protein n=1 Tax=Darwinula stevensoni TaxID=69355 RepID=A0A7R8X944_9CRUS|nr:unnamed protein product [Darwinula stevensoni]CAG0884009.1 unnamed protein product [Darwinula stevensoni]
MEHSAMPRVRILLIASLSLQLQGFVWCKGKSGIYYDNGIGQTVPDEDGEMEEIQEDILTVLGLHHKPHPDASVTHGVDASASRFLLDLYRNFQDEEDATGDAKVRTRRELNMSETDMEIIEGSDSIMTFVNHGHHLSHVRHEKERRLWFDVSGIPLDEELKRAELRIFKEPGCKGNPDDTQPYVLILYKLIQGKYAQEMRLEYVDSKNTTLKEEGWLTFNVTETVKTWSVFPSENLGFYLLISGPSREADIRPSHIGIVNGGDMRRESFLLAYLSSISGVQLHARRTRAAKKNKRKTRNKDRNDYDAWDPSAGFFEKAKGQLY